MDRKIAGLAFASFVAALAGGAATVGAQTPPAPAPEAGVAISDRLAGLFTATMDGKPVRAKIWCPERTSAVLDIGGTRYVLTRDATGHYHGTGHAGNLVGGLAGQPQKVTTIELTQLSLKQLKGTISSPEAHAIQLDRSILPPLTPEEKAEFDAGPTPEMKALLDRLPDYGAHRKAFWYDFGSVCYRGRLDGSARVMIVGSDPGPTECLPMVRRTMVGDAGQRIQGFLTKIGLTRSYVCVNAYAYALHPSKVADGLAILKDPAQVAWRNEFYSKVAGRNLQAIVCFGGNAKLAVDLWTTKPAVPVFYLLHPSTQQHKNLIDSWRAAVPEIRKVVTPDPDGDPTVPNYGPIWTEADYTRIPRRDLPKDAPDFIGDDSWGRALANPQNNCAKRPYPDTGRSLVLSYPDGRTEKLTVPPRVVPPQ